MVAENKLPEPDADEATYLANASQNTHWQEQIKLVAEGKHPDILAFCDSVRRLTKVAWTFADELDGREALGEGVTERTMGEYYWFFTLPEDMGEEGEKDEASQVGDPERGGAHG